MDDILSTGVENLEKNNECGKMDTLWPDKGWIKCNVNLLRRIRIDCWIGIEVIVWMIMMEMISGSELKHLERSLGRRRSLTTVVLLGPLS